MKKRQSSKVSPLLSAALITGLCLSFSLSAGMAVYAEENEEFTYQYNDDSTISLTAYRGSDADVTIPSRIDGKTVTGIGYEMFRDDTHITSVVLPDTVTTVESGAFQGCTRLTGITVSDNLVNVGKDAFSDTGWYAGQPEGDVYLGKIYYDYKG